jgi:tetratricopeptide (TPR) repeat protein
VARRAYIDFDVLLGRSDTGYMAQIVRSPAGEGQRTTFAAPCTDLELENFVLRVGRFRARTRRIDAAPVASAKQLGGRLFDAIFTGEVGECLRRSLDVAGRQDAALRIRLRLSGCPELANLPWELLYDRSDDWFLALSDRTPIVRYVQLPQQPRPVQVTLPLRVLVIRSEPADYPELDLAAEWGQVTAALGDLTEAGALAFTELAAPTLGELRTALMRDTFHVLHYMGHGGFDADNGGMLLFTDRSGRGVPVTGSDLGVMLRDHTSLRVAVLNACEAARTDPADPFAGVADTLVRRGIPAVIAMQFEVSDKAAIEFAPALYGALAAGRPVDAAVAEARKAMYTVSPLEWATPVLYLRADNAHLFDVTQSAPKVASAGDLPTSLPVASPANTHVAQGDDLFRQHRHADAEAAYRAAIKADPRSAPAYTGLGRALYFQSRCSEAETAYRNAIRLDPNDALAHGSLGNLLRFLSRYPEAETACRTAIHLDPGNSLAHYYLGRLLSDLKEYPEAESAYREATRLDPGNSLAHSNLGHLLSDLKKYPEAETACRRAIRLDPDDPQAHTNLADVLRAQKQYLGAESAYREAVRLNPSNGTAHNNLGNVLSDQKRYAEAEAAYREAIRLDPNDALLHSNLGNVLRDQKRDAEAEAAYREAIRLDPNDAWSHVGLGNVLDDRKRTPQAEAAYREAIRLDPGNGVVHRNLGNVLRDQKRYPEAEAAYREAIRLDPSDAWAHSGLGNVLIDQKRHPEAEAAYRESIRLDPGYALAHSNLGVSLSNQKRYLAAEAAHREAIRLDPSNAWGHNGLGVALRNQKRYSEAEAAYREAIRLDPGNTVASANLKAVLRDQRR